MELLFWLDKCLLANIHEFDRTEIRNWTCHRRLWFWIGREVVDQKRDNVKIS